MKRVANEKIWNVLLCMVLSFLFVFAFSLGAGAEGAAQGVLQLTASGVNLRKTASAQAKVLGRFELNQTVAYDGTVVSEGITWYHVQSELGAGYVMAKYCQPTSGSVSAVSTAAPAASAPAATAAAAAAPTAASEAAQAAQGTVQFTAQGVNLRKTASTDAKVLGRFDLNQTAAFDGTATGKDGLWYHVQSPLGAGYVMAKYCQVISGSAAPAATAAPFLAAVPAAAAAETASAPAQPAAQGTVALTNKEKVIVRASGAANGKQVALLNSAGKVCTLLGGVATADGYTWYQVQVKNTTGWIRGDLLNILSAAESAAYTSAGTASSASGTVLYTPELADWETSNIQNIFYKGCVAMVTDVKTCISFQVKRWSGGSHADVEPLTAADTAAICRIYGVSSAQEIVEKNLYQRLSILVTVSGHSYAASMYGVPHNTSEGNTIQNNNYNGQFCIHFTNSKTHGSSQVDSDHQQAVNNAYYNAVTTLTQLGHTFR